MEALNTILLEIKKIAINFSQNDDEIENIPESSDEESGTNLSRESLAR
jgi:hypothetical protein